MIFNKTKIKDLFVISNFIIPDERGSFSRLFCQKEFNDHFDKNIVQINRSFNKKKGTIRGLHYQEPPMSEIKIINCIKGSIFDAVVDLRKDSESFLKTFTLNLDANNNYALLVPEGFAHGFQTLENNTEILYFHSNYYSPDYERGLRYDDKLLGLNWPIEDRIISKRDKSFLFIDNDFKGI